MVEHSLNDAPVTEILQRYFKTLTEVTVAVPTIRFADLEP